MTLLDHSRAQERDAVAKTRPATASGTSEDSDADADAGEAASRTRFFAMAMGCPCFIVAVILFIMNEIVFYSAGGAVLSIFLFMLSAAGCVAGCCLSAICPATPPGDDDVEAPAAVAAPRI